MNITNRNIKSNTSKNSVVGDKRFKSLKIFSFGSCVLLIAILLLLNILLDGILGSRLKFDFSASLQNSLSKQGLEYINSLPSECSVRIVGLFDRPDDLSNSPFEYIVPLLDDMCSKSSGRISVEYKNPTKYPSIISELDPTGMHELEENIYVVKVGADVSTIDPYFDCFTYDNNYVYMGYYVAVTNVSEYAFINTIVNLTNSERFNVYFLNGLNCGSHNEFSAVLSSLCCNSFDLPASDDFVVPDDCDLLVISNPSVDITENMYLSLTDYVIAGGKVLISVDFNNSNIAETYVNLNRFLSTFSINITSQIVSEYDMNYQLNGSPYSSLASKGDYFEGDSVEDRVRVQNARYIKEISSIDYDTFVYPLLLTSDSAVVTDAVMSGNQSDGNLVRGQYTLGLMSIINSVNSGKVICLGSDTFISDSYISTYGYNDANVSFIRLLLGEIFEVKNSVDISAKPISDYSISPTKYTAASSSAVALLFIVIIPVLFVLMAFLVYRKRKNL